MPIDPPITRLSPSAPLPKSIFTSKTAILNVLIAIGAAYPPVGDWVSGHPTLALDGFTVFNIIMRYVSHGKIYLASDDS